MSKSKSKKMAKSRGGGKTVTIARTTDLTITLGEDGRLTGTVSPNAQWAGIQKFVDPTTNDGAKSLWEAQRNYATPAGEGATTSAASEGAGYYRVFSSDFDYQEHVSDFLQIP